MVVKGQTISVVKCQSVTSFELNVLGSPTILGTLTANTYYAPSIGYIVKTDVPVQYSPFDKTKEPGDVSVLIDYELK